MGSRKRRRGEGMEAGPAAGSCTALGMRSLFFLLQPLPVNPSELLLRDPFYGLAHALSKRRDLGGAGAAAPGSRRRNHLKSLRAEGVGIKASLSHRAAPSLSRGLHEPTALESASRLHAPLPSCLCLAAALASFYTYQEADPPCPHLQAPGPRLLPAAEACRTCQALPLAPVSHPPDAGQPLVGPA